MTSSVAGSIRGRVGYLIRETDGDTRVAAIENAREVDRLNAVIRALEARLERLETQPRAPVAREQMVLAGEGEWVAR